MNNEKNKWKDNIDTSPEVSDDIKYTTCYMCACRCGIKVHLKDGKVRYIQGNRNHPINRGVLCGKGSAGIMTQYSPARLKKPLKRVGPRGSGEFVEIEWDEALATAVSWLDPIRKSDPRKLAFFTGRDQSQALTGWWASQFGTPNYAAHGGFCSVNMAAAGLYTIAGSFWEFGEPDWDRTRYMLMFGIAEDHDSNPIKIGLGKLKANGAKFTSVNPIRTGYSAIADEWVGIKPGTDGLLIMALIHELLHADRIDLDYLVRYTNAPWLIIQAPGTENDGLFARDDDGNPLCWDSEIDQPASAMKAGVKPALIGVRTLLDGSKAVTSFQLMAGRFLEDQYSPQNVADETGIPAADISRIAAELAHAAFEEEIRIDVPWTDWAGRKHDYMIGRPVTMHAMRGISAHSNGFQTCRALHILQMILGTIDCPGGFRYKPPFPKPTPPGLKPTGKPGEVQAGQVLPGPPLGFPTGPEDLLVEEDGSPRRIDKAFSWEYPLAIHGMMHEVIHNAWKADPYPIDTLMMFMANMSWNSTMNTAGTIEKLCDMNAETGEYKIPHIIYSDAFYSEMVAYADLILPDTTYLERYDAISLLDRPISEADAAQDAIRHPVLELDRDVRPFQSVLIDLGAKLGLPGLVTEDGAPKYPGGYEDYLVNHERAPGIGPLAGWRGKDGQSHGRGEPNPDQLERYKENQCFWSAPIAPEHRFYKMANKGYLEWATDMGFLATPDAITLQIYCEPLQKFRNAARGQGTLQPPDEHRGRIERYFDPLPFWYAPMEGSMIEEGDFPLHALTQRPMHMYHSWGTQNSWLRQITNRNRLYMNLTTAKRLGLIEDDWAWVSSHHGRIRVQIGVMDGVNENTVWTWNAIGKRSGAWNLKPGGPEAEKGFLLNHLISELLPDNGDKHQYANVDPITGQGAWFDLRVRIEKVEGDNAGSIAPEFDDLVLKIVEEDA
ncbi:MAG: molybdopterin-dependent oxidoreductase [Rhodospirillales bacterium]|jgi:sulfite dehydrogenase (quinone) subunit SoeA|nr:molybdopterin-dependent oxidoreductase [Rhodospirillales bacterium]